MNELALIEREEAYSIIWAMPDGPEKDEAAELALKIYGEAPQSKLFEPFRYDPSEYIRKFLNWSPWEGTSTKNPGQKEILDAYVLCLRQQIEKRDFEHGIIAEEDLLFYKPDQTIKNIIRIEAGHTVGKTKLASGIVSHFLDCFTPSIIYTFAPTYDQIKHLLWKEIESDRGKNEKLPGRILDNCQIKISPNHFAQGRATSNAGNKGTERVQGQHNEFLMFVLDEAEGVADFVYGAVDSMISGGIAVVILLANPKTRTSKFHQIKKYSNVQSFRVSCIYHPNVIASREVIPGAVKRDYVRNMIEKHCLPVKKHNEAEHTFELPFDLTVNNIFYPQGTIFQPDTEFMFRVLGIAPKNIADKTLIPTGIYEAAKERPRENGDISIARFGVDVARYGNDKGTLYVKWNNLVWCSANFSKLDSNDYFQHIKAEAIKLNQKGVTSLHIRVDGGGGFGSGVIDKCNADAELKELFKDFQVFEVHNNGTPYDKTKYANLITELYAETGESLKGLTLVNPPEVLEIDLCNRFYKWINKKGKDVKLIQDKDQFKEDNDNRSPDDGDGCVYAVAPDYCFNQATISMLTGSNQSTISNTTPVDDLDAILGIN